MSDDISEAQNEPEPKKIPGLTPEEREALDWNFYFNRDDAAAKEAELFGTGETIKKIRERAEQCEGDRAEAFRDNFEKISIIALWGVFFIFSGLTLIWAWHQVVPEDCKLFFLSKAQLDKLQIIITSGFITGIASSHVKKRLT